MKKFVKISPNLDGNTSKESLEESAEEEETDISDDEPKNGVKSNYEDSESQDEAGSPEENELEPTASTSAAKQQDPMLETKTVKRPATGVLVNAAIKQLSERNGSSLKAIMKNILSNYPALTERQLRVGIKKYVKKAVVDGVLVQTTGTGANGSFKMSPAFTKNLIQANKIKAKKEKAKQKELEKELRKKEKEKLKKAKKEAKPVKQITTNEVANKKLPKKPTPTEEGESNIIVKPIKKPNATKSKVATRVEIEQPPVEKPKPKAKLEIKEPSNPISTLTTKLSPKKPVKKLTTKSAAEKPKAIATSIAILKEDIAVERVERAVKSKETTKKKKNK